MKEIILTRGKVALVDDEDFEYLNQFKWSAIKPRHTFYAIRSKMINDRMKEIYMHREIMGTPENLQVDHIDHNGLNNQKINLRNCSCSQNQMNRLNKNQLGFRGINITNYGTGKNKYYARIKVNGECHYLGCFKKKDDAALAYDKAAQKYHGEFANLNFKIS